MATTNTNESRPTRNWPASQRFTSDAAEIQTTLDEAQRLIARLRSSETTLNGLRTETDADAMANLLLRARSLFEHAVRIRG